MMLESFAMNRPINDGEIERFLRSFSCAEICQELSSSADTPLEVHREVHHSNRMNETHPSFHCHMEAKSDPFSFRPNHSNVGEINEGIPKASTSTANDKRKRTLFSPMQLTRMEEEFRQNMYVVGLKRWRLATELSLTEKQIKIWFQNRRMKLKREQVKSRCLETGFPWY